jgi:sn-glycerol 3-phosphate transport system ATP-binding protein
VSSIRLDSVRKTYGQAVALDGISLDVREGHLTVLLGPSGCGKSTCLRLIAGLETPDQGRIAIGGTDVTSFEPARRGIAMVFQSYALFPHLDVGENILFGLKVRGVARAERDRRLARVAELVGLTPYLTRKPAQLSGGQRQRVALARAIIAEQRVCLMDEPLSNLDAQLRHEMRLEIRALQQRLEMTMVYVTHDQVEAMTMADSVVLLRDGRIEQAGPPDRLYQEPATSFVARFIGAPPMNLLKFGNDAAVPLCGVRPEHVHLRDSHATPHPGELGITGAVESVEYLGADTVVTVAAGPNRIAARVAGLSQFLPGAQVCATWELRHEHRFDATTGCRLAATLSHIQHAS